MKITIIPLGMILLAACAPVAQPAPTPTTTASPAVTAAPTASSVPQPQVTVAPTEERVRFNTAGWKTNFNKRTVSLSDILSGGPPKDGIPAIDEPQFMTVQLAGGLYENEPVVFLQHEKDVRAYPLQILIWHEIVNDTVDGKPVAITFCPLCNTSIVFDRVVAGEATTFGTTGHLRFSDLVMYDRATESWWQQATGEALVGERAGMKLTFLPSQVISFGDFKARFPDGKVLSTDTGYGRTYGLNPYAGYDDPSSIPFLYRGPDTPKTLRAMDYVVTLLIGDTAMAYPYNTLAQKRVVNDTVARQDLVVIWKGGTSSALDSPAISKGRDIGATGVFSRKLDKRTLTFQLDGDKIKDKETGSTWNVFGEAIDGALKGQKLEPLVHGNHFWFAWAAFRPDTGVSGEK